MSYPKAVSGTDVTTGASLSTPRFPDVESRVLKYWDADGTFPASVDQRDAGVDGSNEFVFYDGPPFANGLPHYGHLLTGYAKDVVPRYQTMRGRRVERRFGWDTHGLPAELEAERQLGITDKSQIDEMGIAAFNDACRESVLRYTDEWQDYVTRQGRWVDFDNDYKTLNVEYMESVIWGFKQLWDKGLVYDGKRVLPYCWRDQTPLSNHELRMDDDVYKSRQDPAVTVGYRLTTGELVLIWTTTPWTMPSNQAMAVHPDVDYVVVEPDATSALAGEKVILAEARLGAYARDLGETPLVTERFKGTALLGRRYRPPFPYFEGDESLGARMHTILSADYVTTDDGTGIVHIAPAFGEEDKLVTDAAGITAVVPVDSRGEFTSEVPDYAGLLVFDANAKIVKDLKNQTGPVLNQGVVLVRHETYEHSYPHCWRCRNPLIYRAVSSWFVGVSKFKDRMVELNEEISWVPGHIKHGQFGKWLANARDWSISRNRYWGTPIPVWVSDDPAYPRTDVYGSLDELERDFGVRPTDLHRPFIDELTRPNPDDPSGQSTMRRVPEVLDVWFDSGSMPFAQVHYPFENQNWFEHHYPGDFIVEYIGQTRGWFYTLHVLATAIFDRPSFSSCVSHGIVLGDDGQKMSKSLRNYPDVQEVFNRDGSDAMRWFLMSSPILRGGNLMVTEQGIRDGVRQVLLPLWNSWQFFATYANAADAPAGNGSAPGYEASISTESDQVLDRYLLAKTRDLVAGLTERMDGYDIAGACDLTRDHLDMLTNWYIRRSRRRFWAGTAETHGSFDVLYTCLEAFCRSTAPLLPMTTEEVYRGLTGARSVHLTDFPDADDYPENAALVAQMDRTREICSAASSLRKAGNLRVRLPLNELTVVVNEALGEEFTSIIADEVNVRSVRVLTLAETEAAGFSLRSKLTVNARAAGPRLGKTVQQAIKGSKTGDWSEADGVVTSGGIELIEGEYVLETVASAANEGSALAVLPSGGFIALDTTVTGELAAEGIARDLVRVIQQARKDADLDVSDRIRVALVADAPVLDAVMTHRDLVVGETLADQFGAGSGASLPDGPGVSRSEVGDGLPVTVSVAKI
ncbi:isoleucine--tRNA ligase [Saxibacter everestensis]|uniref:Isoleucine--tRNA ligase n=1 Tax=Saxibacter everestensis TaxID=2909229 RepID=A0ABY8QYA5_9MICO|nr:isoleucine--tRNA ligase [Brevibacteriaceae bacterium ZFBP1038]